MGWEEFPVDGSALAAWTGPCIPEGTCILIFQVTFSDMSAAEMMEQGLEELSKQEGITILSNEKFENNAGLDAYKAVILMTAQGLNIRALLYIFQKDGKIIVSVYDRLADANAQQDANVDQSLRTVDYE
jgi:hypothetical protein